MNTKLTNKVFKTLLLSAFLAFGVITTSNVTSADENNSILNSPDSLTSTVKSYEMEIEESLEINEKENTLNNGEHIRFSIANLFPIEDFTAQLSVEMDQDTDSVKVEATKGEKLNGEVLLPASIGEYNAILKDNISNEIIFNISGVIELENGNYIHQIKNINSEKRSLGIIEGQEGFNILIGYVEGGIMTEVELLDNDFDQCIATMSLDSNANGIFEDNEKIKKAINSSYSKIEGPQVSRLPLTSNYDVNIECDGLKVASNVGSYDLVNGEAINSKKSRTGSVIGTFGVGFKRNLYVSSDSVMGEDMFPPKQNLSLTEKDGSDSWDTLSPRSSRDQIENEKEINKQDSDISSSESSYSLNFILDWFTDNPWTYLPASLVLAIVVILCFSTVAIVSQRKNHI